MRATRWHCCGAVASCEVPRYGDVHVFCHSAEERPIKTHIIFSLEMVRLAMLFNILLNEVFCNEVFASVFVMVRNKKSGQSVTFSGSIFIALDDHGGSKASQGRDSEYRHIHDNTKFSL